MVKRICCINTTSVYIVELLALREGLLETWNLGIKNATVELDSLGAVVTITKDGIDTAEEVAIVKDCIDLIRRVWIANHLPAQRKNQRWGLYGA